MELKRKAMLLMLTFTFMLSWNIYPGETFHLAKITKACRPEDGYIRCLTGDQCIRRYWHHDLGQDCADNSDETRASLNCSDNEITCAYGKCIERTMVHRERFCPGQNNIRFVCRPEEFTCHITKRCIYRWEVRDGKVDCSTFTVADSSDEEVFLPLCMKSEFMCPQNYRCISREWVGDGVNDCPSGMDEIEQFNECRNKTEFKCKESGRCIPRYRVMDGFNDCQNGTDELIPLTCIPYKEIGCKVNGRCIPRSWRLNNIIDCPNGGDETPLSMDETCTSDEFLCHNHKRCIPKSYLCDGMDHCGDCSDEIESCAEPQLLRCPNDPTGTCIHWDQACDTFGNCPNTLYPVTSVTGFKCHSNLNYYCVLPQYSLKDDLSTCNDGSDLCYRNGSFQCATCLDEMTVIAPRQICDGVIDCPDLSDECLCSKDNSRSNQICNNICYGGSSKSCSICNVGEVFCDKDSLCITKDQVCNGHVDCPLISQDERVCGRLINLTSTYTTAEKDFKCDEIPELIRSVFTSFSSWRRFARYVLVETATKCDGVFECPYFEDECGERANCKIKSPLCSAIPFKELNFVSVLIRSNTSLMPFKVRQCEGEYEVIAGRSICNGVQECTSNLDEMFCPEQFKCDVGTISWPTGPRSVVSINSTQRCDLNVDCIDSSDEVNCPDETHFYCETKETFFVKRDKVLDGVADCIDQSDECPQTYLVDSVISSREFLIKSTPLNILIWFMAFFALLGNAYVAFKTIKLLRYKTRNQQSTEKTALTTINNALILNLSIADFLMAVVLFIIIAKARIFSGQYCLSDFSWRTGITCNAIGVFTVLSSETSVFTLVCISSYRLYSVFYPFASRSMRKRWLGLWIFLIWFASLIISILPLLPSLSNYMITGMWIDGNNPYFARDTITLSDLKDFTKRIVTLNGTIYAGSIPQDWYGLQTFLISNFPNQSPTSKGYFGYYSASGLCIPRFYRSEGETSNALTSIVITFNFLALMYIIAVYIAIYHNIKVKGAVVSKSDQKEKQLKRMQQKITILIATDLCCWLPICIMTFISMSGVILPPIAYAVSAIVLLPINSSLNPIIYSSALTLVCKKTKQWMDQALKNIKISSNVTEQEENISTAL